MPITQYPGSERVSFDITGTAVVQVAKARSVFMHQLLLRGTGSVSATVRIWGTTDSSGVLGRTLIATLTASGTNSAADQVPPVTHAWPTLVYECTTLTGAGAIAEVASVGG